MIQMNVMVENKVVGDLQWFRVENGVVTIQLKNGVVLETGETFSSCTLENVKTVEVLMKTMPRRAFVEEEYF